VNAPARPPKTICSDSQRKSGIFRGNGPTGRPRLRGSEKGRSRWIYRATGFTLIELVMVLAVMGILAASIVYRLNQTSDNAVTVAADQLEADIRYTQMKAMGTGTQQSILFTVGSVTYIISGEPGQKTLPGGVAVTSTTFPGNTLTFNTLGEPTFGASDHTLTLRGTRTLRVYWITGEVE